MTRGRWVAAAFTAAALLLGARMVAASVVEYRWYAAFGDGAAALWRARLISLGLLRGAAGVAAVLFVYANLLGVISTVDTVVLPRRVGGLDIAERVPAAQLRWASAGLAAALGVLLALPLDGWTAVDALLTGRALGELEPVTGHDLTFFVHWLPLENAVYAWALLTLVVTAALVLGLYAFTPGLRWHGGRPRLSGRVRRHLTVFGVGVLLLLAWGHRLDAYALLTGGSGAEGAFAAVDQLGAMPARFTLAAVTALASLVVLRAGWMGQVRTAFWTVSAVVGAALLVRTFAPALTAWVADPRALADADAAAAANRALYTQRAFAVDRIRPAPPGYGLRSAGSGAGAAAAAGAVSAWDAPALARAATAARRTIADGEPGFQPADVGVLAVLVEQTLTASRAGAAGDAGERTVLTLDATRADANGRPVAAGAAPLVESGRRVRVLSYPGAAGSLPVRGQPGAVGDVLTDWRVRLAHALAGRDLRLAFAAPDGDDVRLVDRRDVRRRVEALAPFYVPGRSVTPLLAVDSLWYAVSLYSASGTYPLAQHYDVGGDEWAAFRHAATALVNAQSGDVRLVPAPDLDADARGWVRRFPRLFTPAAALPPALARAVPPPSDGALVQAYAFAQFGARGERPPVLRRVAPPDGGDTALAGPGRAALALPAVSAAADPANPVPAVNARAVPAWSLPLVSGADRVEGAVIALGGPAPATLWLATGPSSPRWQELLDALAAAPTPGDPRLPGATPGASSPAPPADVAGRLRVVPVDGALAYARPDYTRSSDGVPLLARVVALAGDTAQSGPTVAAALGLEPGDGAPDAESPTADLPRAAPDRLVRARQLYQATRDALRRGDWAAIGRALDALGTVLGAPAPAGRTP